MIIYYEPEGFNTCPASACERVLMELENGPFDKINTSSEILVHEAYRLYTERRVREFVLVSGNKAYIADPDRVMRQWPEGCEPDQVILEARVS